LSGGNPTIAPTRLTECLRRLPFDLEATLAVLFLMVPQSPVKADDVVEVTGIAEPVLGTRPAAALATAEGDWLCAWCLNRVANENDRFKFDGRDEFTFTNPEGIRFEIITFSETLGCPQSGVPTLEHTWFPGHAWSYCHCDGCGQHIGWYFTGPHHFAGLIKGRIVRALTVRN
jgi:hypothetical protein